MKKKYWEEEEQVEPLFLALLNSAEARVGKSCVKWPLNVTIEPTPSHCYANSRKEVFLSMKFGSKKKNHALSLIVSFLSCT
jgi:hypothetical protein